jgi:hypothetical protein
MNTPLLTLRVRRKRHVVRAARRARQIGRLLGLEGFRQAGLACGVLELTCRASARLGPVQVEFRLGGSFLQVDFRPLGAGADHPLAQLGAQPSLRVELPQPLPVARDDLAWMIQQLERRSPVNCFEEMRCQAQELLQALAQLHQAPAEPCQPGTSPELPTAA